DQVVGHRCKGEGPSHLLDPPVLRLAEASDSLHAAEAFFDPLPDTQARGIAGTPCCAAIDNGTAVGVAGDLGSDVDLAQLHHEVASAPEPPDRHRKTEIPTARPFSRIPHPWPIPRRGNPQTPESAI